MCLYSPLCILDSKTLGQPQPSPHTAAQTLPQPGLPAALVRSQPSS